MSELTLRPARREDASHLVALIDIAGRGLPSFFWRQAAGPGQSVIEVGRQRAMREEGGFSYRNARIAEADGVVVGMLLGYRQPDTMVLPDLADVPELIRPLIELEALAPGTWYLNAVAIYPEARGRGYGARLLAEADRIAAEEKARDVSLITEAANAGAQRLYERCGYRRLASRPFVAFDERMPQPNEWLLMVKTA